jgi:hypothetical protein
MAGLVTARIEDREGVHSMGIFHKPPLDYLAGSVAGIGLGLLLVLAFLKWFEVVPQTFTLPGAIVAGLGASNLRLRAHGSDFPQADYKIKMWTKSSFLVLSGRALRSAEGNFPRFYGFVYLN